MMQTSLSQNKFVKYQLFRLHIKGGLVNEDKTQILEGSYYPSAYGMTNKIVLDFALGSIKDDQFQEQPKSLRFDSYQQVKALIFHLTRASIVLAKKQGAITPQNKAKLFHDDVKALEDFYNETMMN